MMPEFIIVPRREEHLYNFSFRAKKKKTNSNTKEEHRFLKDLTKNRQKNNKTIILFFLNK